MIVRGADVSRSVSETADVCVVGSGAAGAILAWEMADRGHRVATTPGRTSTRRRRT